MLLLVAACAGPAAVQMAEPVGPPEVRPRPVPPPFEVGERSEYDVSMLGIPAATASLEVGKTKGRWTFEAYGAGLPWLQTFYTLELRMAATTHGRLLRPGMRVREGNNGGAELRRDTRYYRNGRARVLTKRPKDKRRRKRWRRTLTEAFDPLGLLFRMRWASATGTVDGSEWHSFDGVWTRKVSVKVVGEPEEIEVPAGTFLCQPLEMRMYRVQVKGDRARPRDPEDRTWKVWASIDDRHLPVLATGMTPFGPASAALSKYRPRAVEEEEGGQGEAPRVAARTSR